MNKSLCGLTGLACCLLLPASSASAVTRDEVLNCAISYAELEWYCSDQNLTASCSATWTSDYQVGNYVGVAYDWGGYVSTAQFLTDLADGLGAGSHSWHGILACTTGVDCSGYVSQCLQSARYSTSTLPFACDEVSESDMEPGDLWNKAGSHVVIHSGWLADGRPTFFEAAGTTGVVHNTTADASYLTGYTPLRYKEITGVATVDTDVTTGSGDDAGCNCSMNKDAGRPGLPWHLLLLGALLWRARRRMAAASRPRP